MADSRATPPQHAAAPALLHAYAGGMFRDKRVRRILELAGAQVSFGMPKRQQGRVAVWGRTAPALRGRWVAARRECGLITLEDAFLRSVETGRSGAAPIGLVIDRKGVYFDCSGPSELEDMLNRADLSHPDLLTRARRGIARMKSAHLSKYNAFDPASEVGESGYVLVIDQTREDASIGHGGAKAETFAAMLAAAKAEHPDRQILIKTHPEVQAGHRTGHFSASDLDERTRFLDRALSPWQALAGAHEVYAVTSLMGFEAILASHRPHLFGKPFYGGWGLSADRQTFQRRERSLSVEALFAAAMLIYPVWYDPYRDCLCTFEDVADALEAQARAWREDHQGYDAFGIRLWKRAHLKKFFGGAVNFHQSPTFSSPRALVWANQETAELREAAKTAGVPLTRLEDGFLRSRGLGAELVLPLSLVTDDLGIYFDPKRPNRLDALLNQAGALPQEALDRAARLRDRLCVARLSKYNVGSATVYWPDEKRRILVPGQVEDDASIRLGTSKDMCRNIDLLRRARAENPSAFIIYKPHPDVEAGLRPGGLERDEVLLLADEIADQIDAIAAIEAVDEVWTLTSLLGFEALLRDRKVVCLGQPFYAGWGLTRDLGAAVPHRLARPGLAALVHQVLIAYPRYFDPVSGLACPVEVVVERLMRGDIPKRDSSLRLLAKAQGLGATYSSLWR